MFAQFIDERLHSVAAGHRKLSCVLSSIVVATVDVSCRSVAIDVRCRVRKNGR